MDPANGQQIVAITNAYPMLRVLPTMSHECEDCGQEFGTLTELRLHDCPADETAQMGGEVPSDETELEVGERVSGGVAITKLEDLLAIIRDGESRALYQAVAVYETQLAAAHASGESDRYQAISRRYREPLITALDDRTQTEGWEFLAEFIDAYHPATADAFPHVTTILQNVAARVVIRKRVSEGVKAIPTEAVAFFSAIREAVEGDGYDFITEGLHSYGWGIGHPEHPVAEEIQQHAATNIFVVTAMLEHAFYAEQHLAMELLERMIRDDAIQSTTPHRTGQICEVRHLLDAPAGAVSDFSPTIPRYWDWEAELDYQFELDADVEQRIRELVAEEGIDNDLPPDWEIEDLTI